MTLQEWLYKEFGDDPSNGVMYSIPMYSKIWTAAQQSEREKYAELIAAAEAVIERWETPNWKEAEPTAEVIYRLRDAVEKVKEVNQ